MFNTFLINIKRIWSLCIHDKRLSASVIAFKIPSLWFGLFVPFFIANKTSLLWFFIYFVILTLVVCFLSGRKQYKYSSQSFILGSACGISIFFIISTNSPFIQSFCIYVYFFTIFHFFEFFVTGFTNSESLKPDSFLLNHSVSYWIAASASWLEFLIEAYIFPNFYFYYVTLSGIFFCVIGEVIRKLAMFYASNGFTHRIAVRRQRNHTLITNGVYAYCRHPGYVGWLFWSVGTQIILCNPICSVVYAHVVYNFFNDRIYDEERYLIEFFGQSYIAYQEKVGVGIPGIKGYKTN